jgi:hypothetical protein
MTRTLPRRTDMDAVEFEARMRTARGLVESLDRSMDRCEAVGPARGAEALRAFTTLDKLKATLEALEVDVLADDIGHVRESVARVTVAGEILGPIERQGGMR